MATVRTKWAGDGDGSEGCRTGDVASWLIGGRVLWLAGWLAAWGRGRDPEGALTAEYVRINAIYAKLKF